MSTADGGVGGRRCEELEHAGPEVAERLRAAGKPIELESLRPAIEARVMDFREAFAGAPGECRAALGVLLAGRRMAVHRVDTGFRVEGLFEVSLTNEPPGAGYTSGRLDCVVAGARSDRLHTASRRIAIRMQFSG